MSDSVRRNRDRTRRSGTRTRRTSGEGGGRRANLRRNCLNNLSGSSNRGFMNLCSGVAGVRLNSSGDAIVASRSTTARME